MRKGKSLEHLIACLEKALANNPNVLVESPKFLIDKSTGDEREHDVVLTITQQHHTIKIAIECRDRARPATVNQIEEFSRKCEETGINQGIIVSPKGFSKNALIKAEKFGIRCILLKEVEEFDWLLTHGITIRKLQDTTYHWIFYPDQDGIVCKNDLEILDTSGNIIPSEIFAENARRELNQILSENSLPIGQSEIIIHFLGSGLILRNKITLRTVAVKSAVVTAHFTLIEEISQFKRINYKESNAENKIADVAYADISVGEHSARFLLIQKENEGIKGVLIPQGKDNKK